jgi:hypothetical protein
MLRSTGNFAKTESIPAMTEAEFKAAMEKAKATTTTYTAPTPPDSQLQIIGRSLKEDTRFAKVAFGLAVVLTIASGAPAATRATTVRACTTQPALA